MTKSTLARPVYLVDGSRTPFIKAKGKPGPISASDLAVATSKALLLKQDFDTELIDQVIFGCVMPSPDEVNIARIIALRLGLGEQIPAWTVQRNCASGMQAIDSAAHDIACGRSEIVLAGGTEAMSRAPVLWSQLFVEWLSAWMSAKTMTRRARVLTTLRPYHLKPVIGLLKGLTDPIVGMSMGQTAENLSYHFGISREAMDAYAVQSHQRLAFAQDNHYLDEIEPLYVDKGKVIAMDDGLRRDSSVENLAKLRAVFDKHDGKVTAGNSAQISDGAAVVLLASEKAVEKHNLPILAKIVDSQWAGLDPAEMGLGPIHAMTPIMKRHKLQTDAVDYWEINEAFSTQVLACQQAWQENKYCREHLHSRQAIGEIDMNHLNIDGGGVSMGHPVGASGARIVLHLAKVLERNNAKRGMASLCIGGGQGGAILIERVQGGSNE